MNQRGYEPRWVEAFLIALRETDNVQCSAERVGVSRRSVYDYSSRSRSFVLRVAAARAEFRRQLADRTRLRASA